MAEKRFFYDRTCSRCDGSGDDPEIADCRCDCCASTGTEVLELTEREAMSYPGATKAKDQGHVKCNGQREE